MIHAILHFVLDMVKVKVVWVLGPPTLSPRNLDSGFMMVILCHLRVGILYPLVIHTNTGPIIHKILGGSCIMARMVMV